MYLLHMYIYGHSRYAWPHKAAHEKIFIHGHIHTTINMYIPCIYRHNMYSCICVCAATTRGSTRQRHGSRTHERLPHFLKYIYTPHMCVYIYTQPLRVAPQGSDMVVGLTECCHTFLYIYIPLMYIYIHTQPLRVAPQGGDKIVGLTESCHTSSLIEAVWDICVSSRHEPQGKGGGGGGCSQKRSEGGDGGEGGGREREFM